MSLPISINLFYLNYKLNNMNFNYFKIAMAIIMAIACLALAYSLAFLKVAPNVQGGKRILLIIVLLAYCTLRVMRALKMWKNK